MLFIEYNMKKLFTLGCSLTYPFGWKELLAEKINFELINSAMYASSNSLQVKRIHSYIVNNKIKKEDIIIWQITSYHRYSFSVALSNKWKKALNYIPNRNPDPRWDNCQYYINAPVNYFTGKINVDVLSNHPLTEKASAYYDSAQSMEELLSTIILLNNSYKILVFVGWPGALNEKQKNYDIFIKALKNNNVQHMATSMIEWIIRNDLPLDSEDLTGRHPTMETSQAYAEKVLYPKLQNLGWVQ